MQNGEANWEAILGEGRSDRTGVKGQYWQGNWEKKQWSIGGFKDAKLARAEMKYWQGD